MHVRLDRPAPRTVRRRPLVNLITASLVAGLVAVCAATPAAASPIPGGPPGQPEPLALPGQSIVSSIGNVGYLPGSWSVTPGGSFDYSIPLDVPAGRAGVQPSLSLQYDSGAGNGIAGLGWSLTGGDSEITRCGATMATDGAVSAVHYDASDHFCLDGQELVQLGAVPGGPPPTNAEYRTEDDTFSQILATATQATAAMGPDQFVVRTRDGRIRTYLPHAAVRNASGVGWNPDPATGDVQTTTPRVAWLLASEQDRSNNTMTFQWTITATPSSTQFLISKIIYTGHSTAGEVLDGARYVQFGYEDRPDTSFSYVAGVEYTSTKRLKTIAMYAPNPAATSLAWQYNLAYTTGNSGRSLLTSVAKCGSGGGCLRAKSFGWQQPARGVPGFTQTDLGVLPGFVTGQPRPAYMHVVDLNGDGADDLLWTNGGANDTDSPVRARLALVDAATGTVTPLADDVGVTGGSPDWPAEVDLSLSRPLDLYGDGTASIAATYPVPNGPPQTKLLHWDTSKKFVATGISIGNSQNTVLADLNGDGRPDYVTDDYVSGGVKYYTVRLNNGSGFGAATASMYASGPAVGAGCPAPRVTDVDGDGRGDLVGRSYTAAGCGSDPDVLHLDADSLPVVHAESDTVGGVVYFEAMPQITGYRVVVGDFNGDGLEDDLLLPNHVNPKTGTWDRTAALLWNTGAGLVLDPHVPDVPHDAFGDVRATDVNGDGRTDLVAFIDTATTVLLSNGDGTFSGGDLAADGGTADPTWGRTTSVVGDFNGDARPDVVRVVNGHQLLLTQAGGARDVLQTVTDQGTNWAAQTVTYSTAWTDHPEKIGYYTCAYPVQCVRRGMTVVRQVQSRDAFLDPTASAAPYTLQYAYEDPAFDLTGRGFLGFGVMRVWDPQRPSETTYDFSQHKTRVDGKYYPYVERPVTVTTAVPIVSTVGGIRRPSAVNTRVTRTSSTYEVRQLNNGLSYTVFPKSTAVKEWEQQATLTLGTLSPSTVAEHVSGVVEPAHPLRRTDTGDTFDDYADLTDSTVATTNGATQVTHVDYQNDVATWTIGLPTHRAVTASVVANQPGPVTRTGDWAYDALGRLSTAWVEKGAADTGLTQTTNFVINDYGTVDQVTVSAAGVPDRVTHLVYAPAFAGGPNEFIYPYQTWSDHDVAAYRPSVWTAVQPAYGVTVAEEDSNGVQTTRVYDDLGRPTKIMPDGQDTTSFSYANRPDNGAFGGTNGTVAQAAVGNPPQMPQLRYTTTDALGRTVASGATGFNGQTNTTTTRFDQLGRVAAGIAPAPGGTTSYLYDSLDRVLSTTLPDGGVATRSYTFFTTHAVSPGGSQTDTTYTMDGQVAATVAANGAVSVHTSYQYGPFGLLWVAIDDKGHQTAYSYDALGRQVQVDDPDTGRTTDTYFGTGDLAGQLHQATGATTTFSYDDLGRDVRRTDADGVATFGYDTAANGIGKLASTVSGDGIRTDYRYDANGRQTGLDYTDQSTGAVYRTDQTYTSTGRLATTAFPTVPGHSRFTLAYGYNGFGMASTVSDVSAGQPATTLWTVLSRMPDQALQSATFGASTQTLTYDNPSGRLHNVTVATAGGTTENLTYGYQADGYVTSRTDAVTGRSESFGYDSLGELTSWNLTNAGQTRATGYAYDTIGNLTQITVGGAVTETHTYGAYNNQPHTLTGVRPAGASTATPSGYDGQGRQTSGDGRTATYTAQSLPKTVTVGGVTTTFGYDAFGQRVRKSSSAGTTFTVPGRYEHRVAAGGATTDVFYVEGTDGQIGQVVYAGAGTATEYALHDALGSVVADVDATGAVVDRLYYEPFGGRTGADGLPVGGIGGNVDRGFTGDHHDDDLGMIDMTGRVYDPTQHTFLSADPRNRPAANPYSYVRNSPLTYTDPSGYMMCDAYCLWYNDQVGSGFAEFEQAAEAYGEGGAHALAGEELGALDRAEQEYEDHVSTDKRAAQEKASAGVMKSDSSGYTPGGQGTGGANGATGTPAPAGTPGQDTRSATIDSHATQGTYNASAATDAAIDEAMGEPLPGAEGDGADATDDDAVEAEMACDADPVSCMVDLESIAQPDGAHPDGTPTGGSGGSDTSGHSSGGIMIEEMTSQFEVRDEAKLKSLVRRMVREALNEEKNRPGPDE